jgi:hypothetical protein
MWQGGVVTKKHFLTYLALCTMAIAQPILDLYGNNITVFSAAKLTPLEVLVFVLAIVVVPPVIAVALDRISSLFGPRVNEAFRLWLLAGLSFFLGLAIARWVGLNNNIGSVAMGTFFGVLIPVGFDKYKPIREWSRWLSVVSVAVVAGAVLQMQPVLFQSDGPVSDAVIGKTDVGVLQLVLDEFPLFAILGDDGEINAERFPGFAALAAESTWFRDSVAPSNFTHQAVPALFASVLPPKEGSPFLAEYPKNIFTMFAKVADVSGVEPVSSLCPSSVCQREGVQTTGVDVTRMKNFFRDASYVYGQRVLPPVARKKVPSIDGTWGGFGAVAEKFKEQFNIGALGQSDAITKGVDSFLASKTPAVHVVHALIPHAPWRLTPDNRIAPLSPAITTSNPDSIDGVRDTYQTFLYQLSAVDSSVLDMMKRLKASKRWDSTMLIVTADHGISFIPAMPQRHSDFSDMSQSDDVYRIPTFIKFPQQQAPSISDCPISNLDIVPTIVDVLQTTTSWTFAGTSIAGDCPLGRTRKVVSATGESHIFTAGFSDAVKRSQHYAELVSNAGAIRRVAAVGSSANLIGTPIRVSGSADGVAGWTLKQKSMFSNVKTGRGASIPSLIFGTVITTTEMPEGTEGIVTINGIAAGVIGELSLASGTVEYTALLDYTLLTKGKHEVGLVLRTPDGSLFNVGAPR